MLSDFISSNIWLVILWLMSLGMLVVPTILKLTGGYKEVGTLEATRLMNESNTLILDVRSQSEYSQGYIGRAKHVPIEQLANRVSELEKFKADPVLVYCRSGQRAAMGCRVLKKAGFSQIFNLKGGINAWVQADLPLEKKGKGR